MSEDKKHFEFDKQDFYIKEIMPIIDILSSLLIKSDIPHLMAFIPKTKGFSMMMNIHSHYPHELGPSPLSSAISILTDDSITEKVCSHTLSQDQLKIAIDTMFKKVESMMAQSQPEKSQKH